MEITSSFASWPVICVPDMRSGASSRQSGIAKVHKAQCAQIPVTPELNAREARENFGKSSSHYSRACSSATVRKSLACADSNHARSRQTQTDCFYSLLLSYIQSHSRQSQIGFFKFGFQTQVTPLSHCLAFWSSGKTTR